MATQTGSISFEAVGGFSSYASGEFTTTDDVAQMAQPNLTPWFSHPMSDVYNASTNPKGYWYPQSSLLLKGFTQLEDGWAHFSYTNTGSSSYYPKWWTVLGAAPSTLKPSTKYTFLLEVRNWSAGDSRTWIGLATNNTTYTDVFAGSITKTIGTTAQPAYYITATTEADITGKVLFNYGEICVYAGDTVSGDLRVSLYEGEYSGPYKPYIDQSLITRVSTAETSIEQNAENILLRATKTEAYQVAQPNLAPITAAPLDSVYNATTNPNGYWKTTPASWFTSLEDGWIRVYRDNSEGTAEANTTSFRPRACPSVVPGETYTILIEVRNNHSTGSGNTDMYIQQTANNQFWGSGGGNIKPLTFGEETVIHSPKVADTAHLTSDPVELFRYNARCDAGSVLDFELRLSIYEGTYDGPYKPYSGTQLYASQAQLKVANDEIDLRVEKSGVIAAINASTEAEGGSAVKISADKVNIEGAAIFTSGRLSSTSLNNAYDAKGAASTVQDNLDNLQVGGRNLFLNTSSEWSEWVTPSPDKTNQSKLLWNTANASMLVVGTTLTFSCDVEFSGVTASSSGSFRARSQGSARGSATVWGVGPCAEAFDLRTPPADGVYHYVKTVTLTTDYSDRDYYQCYPRMDYWGSGSWRMRNVKLERGNKATDWTPAPEDIEANAVKRTQRIYYRSDSATKPATPSAWVTKEDDGTGAWTKMHVAITSTHKYIYTCEQSEKADGTLGCTAVLRDNTITVIDGGNVITHSIVADKLDADSVKANIVQTTDLSASKITSGDIATERMSANVVKAVKAKVSDLYALVAKIGGFVINATSIFSGTAVTSNADNAVALSTADFTRTVNGTSCAGLRFAIGSKFGVEGDGTLYANGANITSINAGNISSGSISADRIKANVISAVNDGTGTINADKVNVSAIKIGDLDGASTVVSNAANGKSAYDRHTAYRGTCSTAAGTAAKVVACTGFALATGATVEVYCSTANTEDVPTLNVNSTGAKAVWINGAVASASNPCKWLAGDTVTFTYDGTRFRASLPVEGYVTEGTGGGLMVHRKSDATTGVRIADSVDIVRNSVSVANYGDTARIGPESSSHMVLEDTGLHMYLDRGEDGVPEVLELFSENSEVFPGQYTTGVRLATDQTGMHHTIQAGETDAYHTMAVQTTNSNGGLARLVLAAHSGADTASIELEPKRPTTGGETKCVVLLDGDEVLIPYAELIAKSLTLTNALPVSSGGTGQTGVTTVTDVASFIAAASGVTVSSVRVTVWGKLVHAYVVAKPDAAKTSAWTVGTVVAAYRPNAVVTGKPYYTGVDSARIQTNGTMQITACGAVEVGVSFTYLLA